MSEVYWTFQNEVTDSHIPPFIPKSTPNFNLSFLACCIFNGMVKVFLNFFTPSPLMFYVIVINRARLTIILSGRFITNI